MIAGGSETSVVRSGLPAMRHSVELPAPILARAESTLLAGDPTLSNE
jgi:hypothetical protein